MSKSQIHLTIDSFEIGIALYSNEALVIINNSIPGIGTVIRTENTNPHIETDLLIGLDNKTLDLIAIQLAKMLRYDTITFVFSFKPDLFPDFDSIRTFINKFRSALENFESHE